MHSLLPHDFYVIQVYVSNFVRFSLVGQVQQTPCVARVNVIFIVTHAHVEVALEKGVVARIRHSQQTNLNVFYQWAGLDIDGKERDSVVQDETSLVMVGASLKGLGVLVPGIELADHNHFVVYNLLQVAGVGNVGMLHGVVPGIDANL